MVSTYVLLSERDGRFYTGSTGDLKLIYYEACLHTADARRRERFLKTGKGKRYLNNRLAESLRVLRTNELERH